jgi:hypothetical protein
MTDWIWLIAVVVFLAMFAYAGWKVMHERR